MNIIITKAAQHLRAAFFMPLIDYSLKNFSDGELYLKINDTVKGKSAFIIADTQVPAENCIELLLLLDALEHSEVLSITIFFTYFSYARQVAVAQGEACGARVISALFKKPKVDLIYIFHAHAAQQLNAFLSFTQIIDWDFFYTAARDIDVIVAPDEGAYGLAQSVAHRMNKEVLLLHKKRLLNEDVIMQNISHNVVKKRVLIVDDIISTGATILCAQQKLKEAGASQISVAATHGLCSPEVYQKLVQHFTHVRVTNSIAQQKIDGVVVWDIVPLICALLNY